MVAFHNEPSLKAAVMDRLREHRRLDTIVQGRYFDDDGRGCHLGCLTHVGDDTHEAAERLFGLEQRIGYWLEAVFENLPQSDCAAWVIESTEAIPCGADLSKCHHHFGAWLLGESGLLTITDANRDAIEQVRLLHVAAANGLPFNEVAWSAAESSAARSAESAARSAESAESSAESAESSAESAESSAARSAESAAWSAESAAWSAWAAAAASAWAAESAWSAAAAARAAAAWKKIAAKSIDILRAAPVPSDQHPMESCVRSELCARRLWCPDGELVNV